MSDLIDNFNKSNQTCIKGKWYMARPYGVLFLHLRIKDAWRVLLGKSIAVHYKEDEDE